MNTQLNPFGIIATDIMTTRVKSLLPQTSIPEAINELLASDFSEMPIVDESGMYCGMFSERCCMRVLATLVELLHEPPRKVPTAADVMIPRRQLLVLAPDENLHTAMESLLKRKCSGAPVIDSDNHFLGVFSERTCMGFVCEAAYNGLPGATVREFIDTESNRLIDADTDLHEIARIFMEVSCGRLPVMLGDEIAGQLSRRDVLRHSGVLACIMNHDLANANSQPAASSKEDREPRPRLSDTLTDHTAFDHRDESSQTIAPNVNLFSIARLFLVSSFRRFPVLREGRLIGQISRCDLLREVLALTC